MSQSRSVHDTASPEISVIVTVKDGEPYVEAALKSILSQTVTDFELIVVDDGSQDDTPKTLARMALEDARLRVLTLETNVRQAAASNRGLDIARGDFVARMDADDLVEPHWLATELAYLKAHPEVDIVGASMRHITADGALIKERPKSGNPFQVRWITRFHWPYAHNTIMFRRTVGPDKREFRYDPSLHFADDYDFCARIIADGQGAQLPDLLVSYRIHGGSLSQTRWRDQQLEAKKVAVWFQSEELPPDVFADLEMFRRAFFEFEPASAEQILAGLRSVIRHDRKSAPKMKTWMNRKAAALYVMAMKRAGHSFGIAILQGILHGADIILPALPFWVVERIKYKLLK